MKEPLDDVIPRWGISSDTQMALRTDHFVNRTFRVSSCSPTEHFMKTLYEKQLAFDESQFDNAS